jgi:hypothetical protein
MADTAATSALDLIHHKRLRWMTAYKAVARGILDGHRPPLQLIGENHEAFNRLAVNESVHNLRDVGDGDAPVKKVIGFD